MSQRCTNPECGSFECSVPDDHEHWFITLPEVKGHKIKATLLDADTGLPTDDPALVEAAATLGFDVQFPETPDHPADGFSFTANAVTMDFTMEHVDPELLRLLMGGIDGPAQPTFAFEAHYPVKRTFWQWLRRKPRLWNHVYIPHTRLATEEEMNDEH